MESNRKLEVKAIVSVDGESVSYSRLKISQVMGDHHDFEVLLDHRTFDPKFFNSPEEKLKLIHSKVIIDLMHGDKCDNAYVFSGITTHVRMIAEDGMHGGILLTGKSKTIQLERGNMMQSFSNSDLKHILEEVTAGTMDLTTDIKPAWTHNIDFAIQYGESDWRFVSRLCHCFRERYYYTGLDLSVGPHPEFPVVPLTYDLELRSLEFGSRLLPNQFSSYYYKREDNVTFKQDSPNNIDRATGYLQGVSQRSDRLTMDRRPNVPSPAVVQDMAGLIDITKRQKVSTGAEMLYISGECKTCDVRIGRLVQVSMPKSMGGAEIGLYRVYRVIHELDQVSRYRCYFEGVPADLEYLPTPEVPLPHPYPIEATVVDSVDPLGQQRVRVFFPFDKRPCDAWIPISSIDAGGNGKGLGPANRGLSFIAEEGDNVLVSFIDGQHLFHPVVVGSVYHGANAESLGGGRGNHIKSIIDKSNSRIIMNTNEKDGWGITIRDRRGDLIHIDSIGENITINANKNITITAGETMTLNCKNMIVNVDENMKENIGENRNTLIGEAYTLDANNKKEVIGVSSTINVGKSLKQTSGDLKMITTEGDFIGKGAGVTLLQGRLDARISKG